MSDSHIYQLTPRQYYLYDSIPSRFRVESIYSVQQTSNELKLLEKLVEIPFTRDYNSVGQDTPSSWEKEFNLSTWGIFISAKGNQPVAGAAVALDGPVFPVRDMQRQDLAVLWDIRVHPEHKGLGIGTSIFQHVVDWARGKGYGQLGIETDSSNVPACKFYAKMGCELGGIHKYGYSGVPEVAGIHKYGYSGVPEVAEYAMLLWYLNL